MNFIEKLPINQLITKLSLEYGTINFEMLKKELLRKDSNNNPIYYVNIKEFEDLAIIYYNNPPLVDSDRDDLARKIEQTCRSYIIEKSTLKPIASQFNKIIYNDDAKEYLKNIKWDNVIIQKCYEGTMILLFNYNNKWFVSTRRCLRAEDSIWIRNKSYREMFDEAMDGKFTFDELNKDYCYHFVLIHYKNKNIVNYNYLGKEYKELYHVMTTKKYTLEEVDYKINDNIFRVEYEKFDSLEKLYEKLSEISKQNESQNKITTEGYVLRAYDGEIFKSPFMILKIQTEIYQKLMKVKPNNSNIHQNYLELYQKDKLAEFLPYFTKYGNNIIKRINISMRTLAREILNLYHLTRQKRNPHIYHSLTDIYKKILYKLHGLYIENKKQELMSSKNNKKISKSINIHDVYYYIKSLPPNELRRLYYDRLYLLENPNNTFLDRNCIYIMIQSMLMFRNKKQYTN